MRFRTIQDIEVALMPYTQQSARNFRGGAATLDTTRALARTVGDPQDRLRVVHVAGTSGKTTTSYYIAALLHAAGYTVGLTTSPHITSIKERAQVDGEVLPHDEYIRLFTEYLELVEVSGLSPSYFELMMVFAYWVFDRLGVDYAVIETGVGGRYDSSNIARRPDKVCVITDIGFDHVNILGDSLTEITTQKAGIIANGNIVCMYKQPGAVMDVVRQTVATHQATLYEAPEHQDASYFVRNVELAIFAYTQIARRDRLGELDEKLVQKVRHIHVPGRFEHVRAGRTTFVLDGAHNEQKMIALFHLFDQRYPGRKLPIIFAAKSDKDTAGMLQLLAAHASSVVASEFRIEQDMPTAAVPATEIARIFSGEGIDALTISRLADALERMIDEREQLVLVTGSFFAVAEARAWLIDQKHAIVEEV